eukprot:365184-Chlamydomonas_euryale.AAC.2
MRGHFLRSQLQANAASLPLPRAASVLPGPMLRFGVAGKAPSRGPPPMHAAARAAHARPPCMLLHVQRMPAALASCISLLGWLAGWLALLGWLAGWLALFGWLTHGSRLTFYIHAACAHAPAGTCSCTRTLWRVHTHPRHDAHASWLHHHERYGTAFDARGQKGGMVCFPQDGACCCGKQDAAFLLSAGVASILPAAAPSSHHRTDVAAVAVAPDATWQSPEL